MILKSINPHDQSVVGTLKISTAKDVEDAVTKARKAYPSWKETSIKQRVKYIKKYKNLLAKHRQEIAELVTKEMGKPLSQSLDDVKFELGFIDYYVKNAPKFLADEQVLKNKSGTFRITYEPYGVCACIAPWNFPLSMMNSGVLPALIAGNTVVFKPSEHCSLSQKMFCDLLQETDIPDGALNLIIGAGEVGSRLVDSHVDLVWFTGSTQVGKEIHSKCGQKFIKCLLEMGGSSPGIIFADADIDQAVDSLYWARFLNCGQVCTSVKRLFVQDKVFDQVVEKFVQKLNTVKVGDPLKNSDLGPLVSQKQLQTLKSQVKDALDKGARVEVGGKEPSDPQLKQGNYYLPILLTHVNFDMRVMKEEVFGPVWPIMPFKTEKQAIEFANHTDYGLSAEVYTSDLAKAERVAKQIQSGTVAINTDDFFFPECPFGGYKSSGMGREYGKIGMQEFCQIKTIATSK